MVAAHLLFTVGFTGKGKGPPPPASLFPYISTYYSWVPPHPLNIIQDKTRQKINKIPAMESQLRRLAEVTFSDSQRGRSH